MRNYPRNSPEAAARILALVLISDGHVCRSEIEALDPSGLERELGLAPGGFAQVLHILCEDLLASANGSGAWSCSIDEATLGSMLAEIDDPGLQRTVMHLALAAAAADSHLADAEALVVSTARALWGIGAENTHPTAKRLTLESA